MGRKGIITTGAVPQPVYVQRINFIGFQVKGRQFYLNRTITGFMNFKSIGYSGIYRDKITHVWKGPVREYGGAAFHLYIN